MMIIIIIIINTYILLRDIFREVRTHTIFKLDSTIVLPTFLYGSENWALNSLTKTKNWSGRNEVTETSGRLHLLWPQHIWLNTLRNADYRHTRQDRWIQTELAFTLAKNATKPNLYEIKPLQTTRKEDIWKTKEALAQAAVTVETERVKGSNPWCLLWWWWWCIRFQPARQIFIEFLKNFHALQTRTSDHHQEYPLFIFRDKHFMYGHYEHITHWMQHRHNKKNCPFWVNPRIEMKNI
jgi:hypothetical protein